MMLSVRGIIRKTNEKRIKCGGTAADSRVFDILPGERYIF